MAESDKSGLTELEELAIIQCARGCTSGKLKEWPYLLSALTHLGYTPIKQSTCYNWRATCKILVNKLDLERLRDA